MSAVLTYVVDLKNEGKTVEKILKDHYSISSGLMKELKLNGKLKINNLVCRSIDIVKNGDIINVDVSENLDCCPNIAPFKMNISVLYEDDFLLVADKPGGIEMHPCPSNRESTLANGLMYYWSKKGEYHNCHAVNRLDKGTSGVCLFAKNRFAHGCLSAQIKENTFKKQYLAIVNGVPKPNGIIDAPIRRAENSVLKREIGYGGKEARTLYKLCKVSENRRHSLLRISLETGRTHQIRVHFSYLGFPLVGDWLYGNGDAEKELITRQALHAESVEFFHPATKERLFFKSEMPIEMKNIINL